MAWRDIGRRSEGSEGGEGGEGSEGARGRGKESECFGGGGGAGGGGRALLLRGAPAARQGQGRGQGQAQGAEESPRRRRGGSPEPPLYAWPGDANATLAQQLQGDASWQKGEQAAAGRHALHGGTTNANAIELSDDDDGGNLSTEVDILGTGGGHGSRGGGGAAQGGRSTGDGRGAPGGADVGGADGRGGDQQHVRDSLAVRSGRAGSRSTGIPPNPSPTAAAVAPRLGASERAPSKWGPLGLVDMGTKSSIGGASRRITDCTSPTQRTPAGTAAGAEGRAQTTPATAPPRLGAFTTHRADSLISEAAASAQCTPAAAAHTRSAVNVPATAPDKIQRQLDGGETIVIEAVQAYYGNEHLKGATMKVETSRLVFDLLLSDDAADMAGGVRQARICLDLLESKKWEKGTFRVRQPRRCHTSLRVQRADVLEREAQRATLVAPS